MVTGIYERLGMEVWKLQTPDLNGKVDGLTETVRRLANTTVTAVDITVYGGFQDTTDGAPEHMWIEYNGWIYDTMPGQRLRRVAASEATRLQPPSEGGPFPAAMVGRCAGKLSTSQLAVLTAAEGHWANNEYLP